MTSALAAGARGGSGGGKLSSLLREIAADEGRERVSVGDLAQAMHHQAFGALMFVLAAPNVLPSPPGTSIVVGAPLALLSLQLMLRRPLRLPAAIASRSVVRSRFAGWVAHLSPWLERAERLLRPRLAILVSPAAERVIGAVGLMLAAILFLPIPLGNVLPALAICLLALGLAERDGAWVLAGGAMSAAALAVASGVLYGLARITWFVAVRALGA